MVEESVRARQQFGLASLAVYQHPPELEPSATLPAAIEKRLDQGKHCYFLIIASFNALIEFCFCVTCKFVKYVLYQSLLH